MAPLALLLLVLPHVALVPFVAVFALVGLAVDGPFSTTFVLGQEYLPGRHGLASGITLGLAIGICGLIAAAFGALADATSLATTLAILPAFALLAPGLGGLSDRAGPEREDEQRLVLDRHRGARHSLLSCVDDRRALPLPGVGDDDVRCCRSGAFATLRIQRGQLFTRAAAVEGCRMLPLGLLFMPPPS